MQSGPSPRPSEPQKVTWEAPEEVLALFPGVEKDDVKDLINASYNGSGQTYLTKWLQKVGIPREALPAYYHQLQAEVQKMMVEESKDQELVAALKAAGVPQAKLAARTVFTKNEAFEAERRDRASKAFELAGNSQLVSIEHDGTPRLVTGDVDLVAVAASVGVPLVVKPYRTKDELIAVLKTMDTSIPPELWDVQDGRWQERQAAKDECMSYLTQEKKEDRTCTLAFSRALQFMQLQTFDGQRNIDEIFVAVPANKASLYLWKWEVKWTQSPVTVHEAFLVDRCRELVQEWFGPGNHPQLEMKGMFDGAVHHLLKTQLYRPIFLNSLDSRPDLILFDCGRCLQRDSKVPFLVFRLGYLFIIQYINILFLYIYKII